MLVYKKRKRSHGDVEVDMTPRESWAYAQAKRRHWEESERRLAHLLLHQKDCSPINEAEGESIFVNLKYGTGAFHLNVKIVNCSNQR